MGKVAWFVGFAVFATVTVSQLLLFRNVSQMESTVETLKKNLDVFKGLDIFDS